MAWMETLAERQGAVEGFTTDTRVEIAEVDPATAKDTGPGYIPYGLTAEEWAEKQKIEEEEKQQRIAARKAQQAEQQAAPPPPAPVPADLPADDPMALPGFEMEPEITTEMAPAAEDGLAWLESLAADQGGALPEMDLSGLGDDVVAPLDLDALAAPVTEPPAAQPATPAGDNPMAWLESISQGDEPPSFDMDAVAGSDDEDQADLSDAETELYTPVGSAGDEDDVVAPAVGGDADTMAWLESLAREQGADPAEFATGADMDVAANSQQFIDDADAAADYVDYAFDDDDVQPFPDVDALDAAPGDPDDPVAWLDSLAAGSAADPAGDDPFADDDQPEPAVPADSAVLDALNNADDVSADAVKGWMDSLLEQGASRTDAPPDYLDEVADADDEAEMEANIPEWLTEQVGPPPDLDAIPEPETSAQPALLDDIVEPDAVEIPAWLQEDIDDSGDLELDDIFADGSPNDTPEPLPTVPARDPRLSTGMLAQIEEGDSWVEAFELERKEGTIDVENVPDWYRERLRELGEDPGGQSAPAAAFSIPLTESSLGPETTLAQGDPQPVPDWAAALVRVTSPASQIQEVTYQHDDVIVEDADDEIPAWLRQQVEEEEAEDGAVPTWLQGAGLEDAADVPEWLRETVNDGSQVASVPVLDFGPDTGPVTEAEPDFDAIDDLPEPPPSPLATMPRQTLKPSAQRPAGASPAPVEPVTPDLVATLLAQAREKSQAGEIAAAMEDYEQVIRANMNLEAVEADLSAMVKGAHKKNATVLRVLGDTLMRRGELQQALDTYRKALNLL